MDECPICFEELSNTTTRVTTECCNNVLHLDCLIKCDYKCPFCRNEIIDINDETTPLITGVTPANNCYRHISLLMMIFVGGYYIITVLPECCRSSAPPPPPPPDIPPWPGFG